MAETSWHTIPRFASSIFDNLVFHTGAFDSAGVVVCTVRFPVREVICFFLVGITMANDDVFRDIAAAGGKRADVVKRRVISTVRIPGEYPKVCVNLQTDVR